ncbi:hypothetical protein AB0A74_33340 [Saccharothrix sp. NPDC042600]|uniref:hypothetical protein n=1 Tax=Saccharothrix TaxID=2071 RepID=UPI0033FE28C8|nr:hypothetical protein GCM10017745_20410 [Saccharothrix mutabilis subsp. capreolus]
MFGARKQVEALTARVAELEHRVAALSADLERARPLLADTARLEALTRGAESALAALEARNEPLRVAGERFDGRLGVVYRAEVTGYVAVYFTTGWHANVELLVGAQAPPTRVVGVADADSYAGGVVRAGEYWLARPDNDRAGDAFRIHFTPLH